MTSIQPQKITKDLLARATQLGMDWPPSDFDIRRIVKDAEGLREARAIVDYELVMGVCSALRGDLEKMRSWFDSAIKKSAADSEVLTNYAKALSFWNLHEESVRMLSNYADRYRDDMSFQEVVVDSLLQAGRFHAAAELCQSLSKSGQVFKIEDVEKDSSGIDSIGPISDALDGISDDELVPIFKAFGAFLIDQNLPNLLGHIGAVEPIEYDGEQATVEVDFGTDLNPEDAAELDFQGAMRLADGQFGPIESGRLTITIRSKEENSADRAA